MKKLFIIALLTLPLCACATIAGGGGRQNVNVMTSDNSQVQAKILNGTDVITTVLPSTVNLKRRNAATTVSIIPNDRIQATNYSVNSHLNVWFLGNILIGGLIGSTTDIASGAAWQYDNSVIVPVVRTNP